MKAVERFMGWLSLWVLAASATALAQQPHLVNAKLETRSGSEGLEKAFHGLVNSLVEPAWIGYAVASVAGRHGMCCYSSISEAESSPFCCGRCRLEGGKDGVTIQSNDPNPVSLETSDHLLVLFRVAQKNVGKIRAFSQECEIDVGGLPFYWLTDVRPAESIALLASFVSGAQEEAKEAKRKSDSALAAIALHADSMADRALEQFTDSSRPESLRKKAAFWLGSARGRSGYEVLRRLVREDPSDRVREHTVFALSVSKEPEAVNEMISVAHNDKSSKVRGQALFWLAQKAGKKASEAITEAIEKDPETEVKKRAVFALSQLPKDQGVPLLIQVARTHRNPVVRKQAMFWLGQSNDPRALSFFEEVLTR